MLSPTLGSADYHAFISYTRDPDRPVARALKNGLARFGRAAFGRGLLRVFLDETNLDAGGILPARISDALQRSSYLIVLASPESKSRRWVNSEIGEFVKLHGVDRVLICATGGDIIWDANRNAFNPDTTTAIPDALSGAFQSEPFWLDLRWARKTGDLSLRNPLVGDGVARLSARIRSLPLDEVIGADLAERKRFARYKYAAIGAIASLALLAVGLGSFLYVQYGLAEQRALEAKVQRQVAERRGLEAQFRADAAAAEAILTTSPTGALREIAKVHSRATQAAGDLPELRSSLMTVLGGAREVRRLKGPQGYSTGYSEIRDIAISPDRSRMAVVTSDMAYLTDLEGNLKAPPIAGSGDDHLYANAVAWSPNGKAFAIASGDQYESGKVRGVGLRVLSTEGKILRSEFEDGKSPILSIAFLNDETVLAGDAQGQLWHLPLNDNGASTVLKQMSGPLNRVLVIPGGRFDKTQILIAVGRTPNTLMNRVVASQKGKALAPEAVAGAHMFVIEEGATRGQLSIAVSSETYSRLIAVGNEEGEIVLWDADSSDEGPKRIRVFTGHYGGVSGLAVSKDGVFIASGGRDGLIRIWNRMGLELTQPLRGHNGAVGGLAFVDDEKTLISGGTDGTLRLWDIADITSRSYSRLDARCRLVMDFGPIAISPRCDRVAVAANSDKQSRGKIRLVDRNGGDIASYDVPEYRVVSMAFSADGSRLAVGLKAEGPEPERKTAYRLRLYDSFSHRIIADVPTPEIARVSARPNAAEPQFATAGAVYNKAVQLWTSEGAAAGEITFSNNRRSAPSITALTFDPSADVLAAGLDFGAGTETADKFEVRLIDIGSKTELVRLRGSATQLSAIAISADGQLFAAGGGDFDTDRNHSISLWTRRGMPLGRPLWGHRKRIADLQFADDGRSLISADSQEMRRWPLHPAELVGIAKARLAYFEVESSAEKLMREGNAARQAKEWDKAEKAFTAAIALRPDDGRAHNQRANVHFARDAFAPALPDYDTAITLEPFNAIYYSNRGGTRSRLGDWAGAEEDFSKAIDLNYTRLRPAIVIASFIGAAHAARETSLRAQKSVRAELLESRGQARTNLSKYLAAKSDFSEAINLGRTTLVTLGWRALVGEKTKEYAAAFADASAALEKAPDTGWLYAMRARIGVALHKEPDSILADCRKAIELKVEPKDLPQLCQSAKPAQADAADSK